MSDLLTSIVEILAPGKATGLYIPVYQRPKTWDEDNVQRFLEGIVTGLGRLRQRDEYPMFVGVIILYRASSDILYPRSEKSPDPIHVVVDGQQRLTTFFVLSIIFHDLIRSGRRERFSDFLKTQCDDCEKFLAAIYSHGWDVPGQPDNVYPRMIRFEQDRWATDDSIKYDSPLASLIHKYCEHAREHSAAPEGKSFDWKDKIQDENLRDLYGKIREAIKKLGDGGEIGKEGEEKARLPMMSDMLGADISTPLFHRNEPIKLEKNGDVDPNKNRDGRIFRYLLMANYAMKQIKFVHMLVNDGDNAFEIFDSLNSTGEPLTSFETFKPELVKQTRLDRNPDTESASRTKEHIKDFEDRVSHKEPTKKASNTHEMIIWFALAETGSKLPSQLKDQRKYLRGEYKKLIKTRAEGAGEEFTQHLAEVAIFSKDIWDKFQPWRGGETTFRYNKETAWLEARSAVYFLKRAKNTLAIPLISRFYSSYLSVPEEGHEEEQEERGNNLCEAMKATAAFFALWRAFMGKTDGIDDRYRRLMKDGISGIIDPICRQESKKAANPHPNASDLKLAYINLLTHGGNTEGAITDKDAWVQRVADKPLAQGGGMNVARFLLIAALHRTAEDESNPGFIHREGRDQDYLLLSRDPESEEFRTVEHIAPKNKSEGWEEGIWSNDNQTYPLHSLGNLLLLPGKENSVLSNGTPDQKKRLYNLISTPDGGSFSQALGNLSSHEKSGLKWIEARACQHAARAVSKAPNLGSLEYVQKRGEQLANLAWEILAEEWLGWR